jgi:hypothetical protein
MLTSVAMCVDRPPPHLSSIIIGNSNYIGCAFSRLIHKGAIINKGSNWVSYVQLAMDGATTGERDSELIMIIHSFLRSASVAFHLHAVGSSAVDL